MSTTLPAGVHALGVHPYGPGMVIERYALDNGLRVLVLPDHQAPVVCYQTWLAVGSRHERRGKTGIAHLLEHLMFGETERMGPGELDRRLEELGAETNAATFLDWTYYVVNLPADALDTVLELEADRLENLVLHDEQVGSERDVVKAERRQTVDDDVDGVVTEQLYLAAFERHGYRHPTIGSMDDISGLTTEDCIAFYRTYYAPNNATLVVVGDVEPAALLAGIAARYGHLEPAAIPVEDVWPEPPQVAERLVRLEQPTPRHKLAVGYRCPAFGDFDHAPLVLLNEILFGGRASRMHRALVEEREIASDVRASVGNFRDPSLWDMYLTAREGHDCAALVAALDELLDEVVRAPVTAAELERAVACVELGTLQSLESAGGKAEQIGFCETVLSDPTALFGRLDSFRRATRADLLRVARRYLRREARTCVEVVPSGPPAEADTRGTAP